MTKPTLRDRRVGQRAAAWSALLTTPLASDTEAVAERRREDRLS